MEVGFYVLIILVLVFGPWILIGMLFNRVNALEHVVRSLLSRTGLPEGAPEGSPESLRSAQGKSPEGSPAGSPPERPPIPVPPSFARSHAHNVSPEGSHNVSPEGSHNVSPEGSPESLRSAQGKSPAGPPAAPRSRADWEMLIGGTLLNRIGAVALVLSVVFFLKYAFDNDLIPPIGRVAIGFAAGAVLMVLGHRTMRKGLDVFAQGITAASIIILYLSAYATFGFYDLLPQSAAFALMIAVTLVAVWRGIEHNSRVVVLMATMGGLSTPLWLSTGEMNTIGLWTYLVLLSVGMYALSLWNHRWRPVSYLTSAGMALWWLAWSSEVPASEMDLVYGSSFMVLTIIVGIAYHLRRAPTTGTNATLEVLHGAFWFSAIMFCLWDATRTLDALVQSLFIGGAAIATGVAAFLSPHRETEPTMPAFFASASILTAALLGAIPENAHTGWIIMAGAAIAGITLFERLGTSGPVITARVVAVAATVLFVFNLGYDGAFYVREGSLPIATTRSLVYLALTAALLRVGRNVMPLSVTGWVLSFLWIAVELRDAVVRTLDTPSDHGVYAGTLVGCATIVVTGGAVIAAYRKSGLPALTFTAAWFPVAVTMFWSALALTFYRDADYTTLFNVRMGTGLVIAGVLGFLLAQRSTQENVLRRTVTAVALVLCTFVLASTESIWTLAVQRTHADDVLAATLLNRIHLILSGVWIAYGSIVVAIGFWRHLRIVRLGGIGLLGLAILKVFLYDLSSLEQPYRIVSFVALGVILLGASFAYTKFKDNIIRE